MPSKVDDIVKAIKREHPDYPEEKVWAIAYSTYNKWKERHKAKNDQFNQDDVEYEHECECGFECECDSKKGKQETYPWAPDNDCRNVPKPGHWRRMYNSAGDKMPKCVKVGDDGEPKPQRKPVNYGRPTSKCKGVCESIAGRDYGFGFKKEIVEFFYKNPEPQTWEIEELAEELGVDVDSLNEEIYRLTSSLLTEHWDKYGSNTSLGPIPNGTSGSIFDDIF